MCSLTCSTYSWNRYAHLARKCSIPKERVNLTFPKYYNVMAYKIASCCTNKTHSSQTRTHTKRNVAIEIIYMLASCTLHITQKHQIKIDDESRRNVRNIFQYYRTRIVVLFFELQCSGFRAKFFFLVSWWQMSRALRVDVVANFNVLRCDPSRGNDDQFDVNTPADTRDWAFAKITPISRD